MTTPEEIKETAKRGPGRPPGSHRLPSGGTFGGGAVGYLEHEIDNWIRARVRVGTDEPVAEPVMPLENLRIISVAEVVRRVGFSRVSLWRFERAGKFPRRVRVFDAAAE